jgi:hypothetical protein
LAELWEKPYFRSFLDKSLLLEDSGTQVLTPKVKPLFRLEFVEDILAIGRMLKLVLCFHNSKKSLVFGFVKRLEKQQLSVVWASPRRAH